MMASAPLLRSARVLSSVPRQQIKRTIFSDDAAVIVVDVLSRKRDTFFTYDAANVVGDPKQRAVITQEVIPVAVFEVAASVNNQLLFAAISAVLL